MHQLLIAAAAMAALAAGVASAQPAPGGGRFAAMIAEADANHDGDITRAEFDAARSAHFTTMDADHNGSLSASEMPHWGGGAAPAGGDAQHMRGDANGDGSVSRAEWDADGARLFARLDADGNGVISQAEVQAAQQQMQQH